MEFETLSKKQLVNKVKYLYEEQSKLQDNVNILIAKISHELKTPLNSIIGFSELFCEKCDNPKLNFYIENVLTSSKYMLSLVQNMIDLARSQYQPMSLSYSIFNTKDEIEKVIKNFNDRNILSTLIDVNICADYTKFKQVIFNLISNSVKFTPSDGIITIMTYLEQDFFYFEITDSGEGIEEKNLDTIFEMFAQVSDDKEKRKTGSGIGLPLCKAIALAHKGNICVSSKIGKGSTFVFKIPIKSI